MAKRRNAQPPAELRFRTRSPVAGIALALAITGCDLPTDPPVLESRWLVPVEETRFGVADLLPPGVSETADGTAFLVDLDPVTLSESLGSLCPECLVADGVTVPKPPFSGSVVARVALPPEVRSAAILDGEVAVEIVNGFNFDPLRPADGVTGIMTLDLHDSADGDLLGTLTVDGAQTAFPAGSTLSLTVELLPGSVEGNLESAVHVDSPLGDPVTVDAGLFFTVTATPLNVRGASVSVDVASRAVELVGVSLDVAGVDAGLADRVVAGGLLLAITNPFAVGGTFSLVVDAPGMTPLQKSVAVTAEPESTAWVELSAGEIRSFLGQAGVTLSGIAVVDPASRPISLFPGEELVVATELDLTVRTGG